jgi:CBS domain-containing protein
MQTVRQILQNKGKKVWAIPPDASIFAALQMMAEKDVGALVVLDNAALVGIFSERDYARKCMLPEKSTKEIQVKELMSSPVITVRPGLSIGACMTIMTNHHVRHLPMVEGEKVIGLISIGDVVKTIIAEQQQLIHELGSYITGGRNE